MSIKDGWPREKNWKHINTRSEKLSRAKQLGMAYPQQSVTQLTLRDEAGSLEVVHVLFVCSRNQWRSPTAERMWKGHARVIARSAGTSPNARHPVSAEDLRWADMVIVMEQKHKDRLCAGFARLMENKTVHVLDIPDDYRYMDPELMEELARSVGPLLGED